MPATTRRSKEPVTEPVTAPVSDDADQLRALVSAVLSGAYKEEFYLWDIASLCRAKPEFAGQLLTLIDRYHRLGQMSAAQHQKIKDKIDQTVASRAAPLSRNRASDGTDARARATTTAPLPTAEPVLTAGAAAPAAADTAAAVQEPAGAAPVEPAAETVAATPSPAEASAPQPVGAAAPATPAQAVNAIPGTAEAPIAAAVAATAATRPVRPAAWAAATMPPASAAEEMTAVELLAAAQRMEGPASATTRSWPREAPQPQAATPGWTTPSATQGSARTMGQSAAQSTPVIAPGTVLCNRYELQALLGSGGMGSVYRALDRYRASLGLPDGCVALKIVTAQPLGAANVLALVREFHNAQQLSHPNVINVYEIDHEGGASFYTMELLDGERLSQLLERIGAPLSAPHALSIIRDIGAGIAHAHSRGVVHGDLKPHNIFITYGGQVRVLDFGGLSHSPPEPWIADPDFPRRGHSYRTATPAYASCEQLEGRRAEPRDDIYAMACITYELLTGRHPFDCKSSTEARTQRLRPSRPPRASAECWHALRRGLAWERAQRPARIEPWLEQLGVAAAAEQLPPTHQLTAAPPRRSGIGGALAAIVLLLALGAAVFTLELHGDDDWKTGLTAASGRLQGTWHQWRTAAGNALSAGGVPTGGAPASSAAAGSAPVNADLGPAAAATAPGTAAEAPINGTAAPAGEAPAAARAAGDQDRTAGAREPRIPRAVAARAGATGRAETGIAAAPSDRLTATAPDDTRSSAAGAGAVTTADQGAAAAIGVRFAAPSYRVADTAPAARVVIRRTGSARDDVRFVWWTVEDSAKAEVDYAPLGVRTEDIPSGADDITIYIPIISNPLRHQTTRFYVALGAPGTSAQPAVPSARATVTIERGG